jgi:hypothetical protein
MIALDLKEVSKARQLPRFLEDLFYYFTINVRVFTSMPSYENYSSYQIVSHLWMVKDDFLRILQYLLLKQYKLDLS